MLPASELAAAVGDGSGNVWLVFQTSEGIVARRLSVADQLEAPRALARPPVAATGTRVIDAQADGTGGLAVLALADDAQGGSDEPFPGPDFIQLQVVQVRPGGRPRQAVVARAGGGTLAGALAAHSGHLAIAYHRYGSRPSGVFVRRFSLRGGLSRQRRLRHSRAVADLEFSASGKKLTALLDTPRSDRPRLSLQRFSTAGPRARGIEVANPRTMRGRELSESLTESLALDVRGRVYVEWEPLPAGETDANVGFARVVTGRHLSPQRVLYRCRPVD
jgi:hypothetical protein